MFYVGVSLMVWLAAGFLTAIKIVWVEQALAKDKVDKIYKESDDYGKFMVDKFARKKSNFITLATLMGFITLFAHIVGVINKFKKKQGKPHKEYKRYGVQFIFQAAGEERTTMRYVESVEVNNTAALRDALDSLTNVQREMVVEVFIEEMEEWGRRGRHGNR